MCIGWTGPPRFRKLHCSKVPSATVNPRPSLKVREIRRYVFTVPSAPWTWITPSMRPGRLLGDLGHLPDLRVAAAPDGAGRGEHDQPVAVVHLPVRVPPKGAGEHLRQDEGVGLGALAHPELHHVRIADVVDRVGHPGGTARALVDQAQAAALQLPEVEQQVHPFGGRHGQRRQRRVEADRHRGGQQSAVAADLVEHAGHRVVLLVEEHQVVDAGVGGVDEPEPVPGGVGFEVGPDHSVDRGEGAGEGQRDRSARLGVLRVDDDRLVQQPPVEAPVLVGVEVAVGEDQRHLPLPARQSQRVLLVVAQQIRADEPGVHVEPGDVHGMVVVPPLHGLVVVRVLGELGVALGHRVVGPAVVAAAGLGAVQMRDGPGGQRGHVRVGLDAPAPGLGGGGRGARRAHRHLDGGDRVLAAARHPVGPGDPHPLAAPHLDGGAGHGAVVAPHQGGRELAVQPHPGGADGDLRLAVHIGPGGPQHFGNREPVGVRDELVPGGVGHFSP